MSSKTFLSRFRFSLGTLMLIVLLIGDGVTVWWRWEPWVLRRSFNATEVRASASFSLGGNELLINGFDWDKQCSSYDINSGLKLFDEQNSVISPDGRWALKFQYDKEQVVMSRIRTSEARILIERCKEFPPISFSPDNKSLLWVRPDNALTAWEFESSKELFSTAAQNTAPSKIGFTPDSKNIFAIGMDGNVRFWNSRTGKLLGEIRIPRIFVDFMAFSPDSRFCLASCSDAKVRIYNLSDLKLEKSLGAFDDYIYTAAFSNDATLIATSTWSGTVEIWSVHEGAKLQAVPSTGVRMNTVAFSPNGERLLTGGVDASLRVWEAKYRSVLHLPSAQERSDFSPPVTMDETPKDRSRADSALSADETSADDANSITMNVWQSSNHEIGHTQQIAEAKFIGNGAMILTRGANSGILLWDANTGENINPDNTNQVIAVMPDGRTTAVYNNVSKEVEIWELRRSRGARLFAQPEIGLGCVLVIVLLNNLAARPKRANA